jgi:cell division protein FtsI (penicillin-binding protein 3)
LERAYRRFGFGERTGLPLPGEARARFGERRWYEVEVATVAFGQGVSVTSVQLAQGLAAVANGGRLVRPLLVRRITDATGALVEEQPPDPGRPALRPGMARLLAEMLTAVTEPGGTGIEAAIPGVPVAGKTGTAQKANIHGRGYDDSRWTSSFIGFVPADHPRLVITVVIDEPQPAHSGGAVAAPVFRRIAEDSLRYLGALPAHGAALATARLPTSQDRDATRDVGPTGAITAAPTRHAQPGDGVPELLGRSARAAVATLAARGLEAVVDGSGEVVRQDPPAGSPVPGDRRVRVWLEPGGRYTPAVEETAEEP